MVAAAASVCGIIVLAFPISMIIDKFNACTGGLMSGGLGEGAASSIATPTHVDPAPVITTVSEQFDVKGDVQSNRNKRPRHNFF